VRKETKQKIVRELEQVIQDYHTCYLIDYKLVPV